MRLPCQPATETGFPRESRSVPFPSRIAPWRPLGLAFLGCLLASTGPAEPVRPTADQLIFTRAITKTTTGNGRIADSPPAPADLSPEEAAAQAMQLVAAYRTTLEPSCLEKAMAVLAPWQDQAEVPVSLLVARATLAQRNHRFAAALEDLDRALRRDPDHVQALLTRTTILRLTGRLDDAARSILTLHQHASRTLALTAAADLASVRGQAEAAWVLVQRVLAEPGDVSREVRGWIETTAAEIALRSGRADAAEGHFRRALELAPEDLYARLGLADLLLAAGRGDEVVALAAFQPANVDLKLRHLLARQGRGEAGPTVTKLRRELETRFLIDQSYAVGRHWRTEARFALEVARDPAAAFALAQQNWAEQKEPVDAALLLTAASAAGADAFLASFPDELERIGLRTPALAAMLHRLR